MQGDTENQDVPAGEFETMWIPQRTALTVLLGLPGIVASAALTGLLASAVFSPSTSHRTMQTSRTSSRSLEMCGTPEDHSRTCSPHFPVNFSGWRQRYVKRAPRAL